MAVATSTAILATAAVASAGSSIMASRKQAKAITQQAEYNAQVYEQQAEMIQQKKKINDYQFARNAGRLQSSIISKTAGKGLMLSGSPLAVLVDNESQMLFDKAITDYNFDVEKNYSTSGASYYRATGAAESRLAKWQGYSNAFSTALNFGSTMALRAGKL